MNIAFIDPARAYAADAPYGGSLGGTQSAVCYLAAALAKLGHSVTLYNHIAQAHEALGVTARPWTDIFDGRAAQCGALVIVGRWTAEMIAELRKSNKPVIGWMHEAAFDRDWIVPDQNLAGIVFVSDWQRRVNAVDLPAGMLAQVIRNGISPFAEGLARDPQLMHRKNPHRVVFAGDAVRGLIPLVEIWPQLQAQDTRLTLEVYSDPDLKGVAPDVAANFRARLSTLPGLAHVGKVGQPQLAEAMAGAMWHVSPNPYPETSCIVLLEALALGCRSVVTARAALPESAHGFATLVPVADADNHRTNHVPVDVAAFVQAFIAAQSTPHDPAAQQAHFLDQHTWTGKAAEWVKLLQDVI